MEATELAIAFSAVLKPVSCSHLQWEEDQGIQDLNIEGAEFFLSNVKWSDFSQWFSDHIFPLLQPYHCLKHIRKDCF